MTDLTLMASAWLRQVLAGAHDGAQVSSMLAAVWAQCGSVMLGGLIAIIINSDKIIQIAWLHPFSVKKISGACRG